MPQPINISGSRSAAILGLSGYSTQTDVWLEIMESREPGFCERNNYARPEREENASMRWGKAFESAIIELAEARAGDEIRHREDLFGLINGKPSSLANWPFIIQETGKIPDDSYITCHLDGVYEKVFTDDSFPFTLHEGKTTSAYYFKDNFGEPGTDEIPIEYQIQTQHQMICTGAEKVILSVLVFPKRPDEWEADELEIFEGVRKEYFIMSKNKNSPTNMRISALTPESWAKTLDQMGYFHQYNITADPKLQKLMLEKYADFWNNHVLTGKPPEPANYDDIKKLIREPVGTIIADEQTERFALEYMQINDESGKLDKRKDEVKTQILSNMSQLDATMDDESEKKWILRDGSGNKLGQFDGKTFRAGRLK